MCADRSCSNEIDADRSCGDVRSSRIERSKMGADRSCGNVRSSRIERSKIGADRSCGNNGTIPFLMKEE